MTEIDIACLPKDLPEFIEVDLSGLDTAHSLHVSGVKLPPGVTAVTHRTGDPVVATAVVPKAIVETEETPEGEAAAAAAGAAPAAGAAAGAAPAPGAEAKPAAAAPEEKGGKKEGGKDEKKK
jgi:large subunit ribosomal protein L25